MVVLYRPCLAFFFLIWYLETKSLLYIPPNIVFLFIYVYNIESAVTLVTTHVCPRYFCLQESLFSFVRPCDRNLRDAELISCRLRRVEPLCRLPGSALQQLAMCGFYEDLEKGVTCKYGFQNNCFPLCNHKIFFDSISRRRTRSLLVCSTGWIAWGAISCGWQWKQSK